MKLRHWCWSSWCFDLGNRAVGLVEVYVDTYIYIDFCILATCYPFIRVGKVSCSQLTPLPHSQSRPSIHPSIHTIKSKIQNRDVPLLVPIPFRLGPPIPTPATVPSRQQQQIFNRARPFHERGVGPCGAHECETERHSGRGADAGGEGDHWVAYNKKAVSK